MERTKGIFVFSTLYNHVVVGPTATDQESRMDRSIRHETAQELTEHVQRIIPDLHTKSSEAVVGEYVGIRPESDLRDYQIHLSVKQRWLVCASIRSTGLTASLGIGRHVIQMLQSTGILPRPTVTRPI